MKTVNKLLIAGLLGFSMLTAMAQGPKPHNHGQAPEGPRPEAPAPDGTEDHGAPMCHAMMQGPMEMQSVRTCYVPQMRAFAVIDSIDCAVDLVVRRDGEMVRVGRYQTDNIHKRHDLKNILRPRSVSIMGDRLVFIASCTNDSSYLGVLDIHADAEGNLPLVARRGFSCNSQAIQFNRDEIIIAGHNAQGYDINIVSLRDGGLDHIDQANVESFDYRKPKQSERIKESDPVGIGLTVVAVAVVFIALLCISLILMGSGKFMMNLSQKGDKEKKTSKLKPVSTGSSADEEVYAAIAAAIHLYNDELHDDEEGVITIQKVEREWTPWNAKYYNMNHYFINRK